MKKYILLTAGLLIGSFAFAQEDDYYTEPDSTEVVPDVDLRKGPTDDYTIDSKKPKFGLQLNTAFASYGKSNVFSSSVSPFVTTQLDPKFRLTTGISLSNSNYSNLRTIGSDGQITEGDYTNNSATLFFSGEYLLNDRVTLYGTGYYDVNNLTRVTDPNNPFSRDNMGMSFGARIKTSDNSAIGIHFQYNKGASPFRSSYYNGYGGGSFQNTFGASPFSGYGFGGSPF